MEGDGAEGDTHLFLEFGRMEGDGTLGSEPWSDLPSSQPPSPRCGERGWG